MSNIKLPILSDPTTTLKSWSGALINNITELQGKFTPISNWEIKPVNTLGLNNFTPLYGRQCVINNLCHYMGRIQVTTTSSPNNLIFVFAPLPAARDGDIFGSASSQTLTNAALNVVGTISGNNSAIIIRTVNSSFFNSSTTAVVSFFGFYEID